MKKSKLLIPSLAYEVGTGKQEKLYTGKSTWNQTGEVALKWPIP